MSALVATHARVGVDGHGTTDLVEAAEDNFVGREAVVGARQRWLRGRNAADRARKGRVRGRGAVGRVTERGCDA